MNLLTHDLSLTSASIYERLKENGHIIIHDWDTQYTIDHRKAAIISLIDNAILDFYNTRMTSTHPPSTTPVIYTHSTFPEASLALEDFLNGGRWLWIVGGEPAPITRAELAKGSTVSLKWLQTSGQWGEISITLP